MKKYICLLCALLSFSFYSCTNEEAAVDGARNRIKVSFNLPGDAASTRGEDITTPATDAEKALNSVNLYCFNYSGGAKGQLVKILSLNKAQIESNNSTIDLHTGDYYFEAVANEANARLDIGDDYADFQALRANTDTYSEWSNSGFLMQGARAARVTNTTTSLDISFTMIRLAARIDVVNKVQGLTITKATLENSVNESFYLEDATSIIAKEEDNKETRTATGLNIGASEASTCLFYTYEGNVEESGLQISFEGTDADEILHKSLPIVNFSNQNAQPAIKRNKLYVVTLEEVDGAIKAEVAVEDWKQKSIDADVTVKQDLKVDFPTDLPDGVTVSNKSATSGDEVSINIPDTGADVSFQITSSSIEVEAVKTVDADWLSINEITTRALTQNFKINVDKNATETPRTATFVVRNKLTHQTAVTYTVTQAAAGKTGLDWSNLPQITVYNAATLEQWADSKDAVSGTGKSFFMYGINAGVDTSSPSTEFDAKGSYWQSSNDPSENGYYMATKADWEALAEVSNVGSSTYLTYNGAHYYISTNSRGSNRVKIVFQQCGEDGTKSEVKKTIEFGGGGGIITQYNNVSPYSCKSVRATNISYYWCAGGVAHYVDLSYLVAVMKVPSTTISKGTDWYAMRIRSLKKNNE